MTTYLIGVGRNAPYEPPQGFRTYCNCIQRRISSVGTLLNYQGLTYNSRSTDTDLHEKAGRGAV